MYNKRLYNRMRLRHQLHRMRLRHQLHRVLIRYYRPRRHLRRHRIRFLLLTDCPQCTHTMPRHYPYSRWVTGCTRNNLMTRAIARCRRCYCRYNQIPPDREFRFGQNTRMPLQRRMLGLIVYRMCPRLLRVWIAWLLSRHHLRNPRDRRHHQSILLHQCHRSRPCLPRQDYRYGCPLIRMAS